MNDFIKWCGQVIADSQTSKPSVKRYGLALAVTVLCGVVFGLGIVISIAVVSSNGRDQVDIVRIAADTVAWVSTALLTAVSSSYVADKAVTTLSKGKQNEQSN